MSIEAEGSGLKYKWQYSVNDEGNWKNLSKTTNYVNVPVKADRDGYQYRCIITDENGFKVISKPGEVIYQG